MWSRVTIASALLSIGLAVSLSAQERGPVALALTNANVVDVRAGEVRTGLTVVLRGGTIASIGTDPPPTDTEVRDLAGKHLLPGLIDAHTHLSSLRAARTALESGVTTVRSASVGSFRDVALRELVRAGVVPGPDVRAAGLFVGGPLGEAVLADPSLGDLLAGAETPEQLRRVVRANLAQGVDVIKTRGTERAGLPDTDPRKQVFTEAELRAVVEEAATRNVPVAAHAHGDEGALAAVKAGVRSIEHGTYLSDATLRLMRDRGTFLVPTYSTVDDLAEPGGDYDVPLLRLRGRHMRHRLRETVRRAYDVGLKIATGADTSYGPESLTRIAHEVASFVEIGLTPLDALRAATLVAADLLQLSESIGAVEVGLEADLIVVERNPLEDVMALQDVLLVVSNGWIAVDRLEFGR